MSSTPGFLLWSLQHTSRPDFPLANFPIWMLVNCMCDMWSRYYKLLDVCPEFLDFLQKMPAISQQYIDQLSPICASQQGPGTKAFEHYKMIVRFQHYLLNVTHGHILLSIVSATPDLGPPQSAPAPIRSILLNPATEAAAVLELAGACQFVAEKDLAKGSRKQTQQTKPQNGPIPHSSSSQAIPVTAPDGFEYSPPPFSPDHTAAPVRNGQVAVAAVAKMLGEFPQAYTMVGAFKAPVQVLEMVVKIRSGPPSTTTEMGQVPFSEMSLASLAGLKLLLEVAALSAGMDGSLGDLVWLMLPTGFLLTSAACHTSYEQRQAFIAERGKLLLQVLWRVGKAMSAQSQQKQPVLGNPDALVSMPHDLTQRIIISNMVNSLDVLVRPSRTCSGFVQVAGVYGMHFTIIERLQCAACGRVRCVATVHGLYSFLVLCFVRHICIQAHETDMPK